MEKPSSTQDSIEINENFKKRALEIFSVSDLVDPGFLLHYANISETEKAPDFVYKYFSMAGFQRFCSSRKLRASTYRALNDPFEFLARTDQIVDQDIALKGLHILTDLIKRSLLDKRRLLKFIELLHLQSTGLALTPIEKADIVARMLDPAAFSKYQIQVNDWILDFQSKIAHLVGIQSQFLNLREVREMFANAVAAICFSESPFIEPMWAHYGDESRGVVVGFKSNSEFLNSMSEGETQSRLRRVRYNEVVHLDLIKSLDHVFVQKGTDWSYEREWRALYGLNQITSSGNDQRDLPIYLVDVGQSDILELYLGVRGSIDAFLEGINLLHAAGAEPKIGMIGLQTNRLTATWVG